MRFALVCGAGIPTLRGAFLSAKRASERKSLPRSEFRRVIAVERHASLFSSAYVCVKKVIARTDVEGRPKGKVKVCRVL